MESLHRKSVEQSKQAIFRKRGKRNVKKWNDEYERYPTQSYYESLFTSRK